MSANIEALEKKYIDLRQRLIVEIERVEGRLEFYSSGTREKQTEVMEKKYIERREKLFSELDKVDSRLQSYASMRKASDRMSVEHQAAPLKTQKMYRGRPVA